ncbi:hypothetical protein QTP70_018767 [Hemibagrus guttatus]|uniref:Uncharacterized protein n=1 Tax=Hemibagrus guttatus TaxID=175788 RepID=A0AAE0UPS2_9TELE|nr:hypothetical protein QTP70_018767 [Hemibagrus guttatus]
MNRSLEYCFLERVYMVCNNVQVGGTCQSNIHMDGRTKGFPAEHCTQSVYPPARLLPIVHPRAMCSPVTDPSVLPPCCECDNGAAIIFLQSECKCAGVSVAQGRVEERCIMQEKDMAYDKWKQPGWRIEQKYSSKVLVGNWAEERLQFSREGKTANSSNRLDFRPHPDHRPDVIIRRTALRRSEGLPTRLLFSHHNTPTSHYLVTLYDESYGRRSSSGLPKLRTWHTDKMGWVPEKSDHPLHRINP